MTDFIHSLLTICYQIM